MRSFEITQVNMGIAFENSVCSNNSFRKKFAFVGRLKRKTSKCVYNLLSNFNYYDSLHR